MHQVIIIGGGPVGLSAAIALAHQGIASVLIEKHPTTTNHPKARGVNGRTMELFRLWGLEKQLQKHQMPKEAHRFTWIEDFQGKEITRVQGTVDYTPYSPTERALIAQDDLEQELVKKAKSMPLIDLGLIQRCSMLHKMLKKSQLKFSTKTQTKKKRLAPNI